MSDFLSEIVESVMRGQRRRAEVFRKGVVSRVDKTVTPWLVTIEGRPMPIIWDGVEVGDLVFWVDKQDPFAWSKYDVLDVIPGSFTGFRMTLYGSVTLSGSWFPWLNDPNSSQTRSQYQPFLQSTWSSFDVDTEDAIYFGHFSLHEDHLRGEVDQLDATSLDFNHGRTTGTGSPPEQEYPDLVNLRPLVKNLDRAVTLYTADTMQGDCPPVSFDLQNYTPYQAGGLLLDSINGVQSHTASSQVMYPAHSIRDQIVATELVDIVENQKIYLPRVDVPGPDWVVVWLIMIPPTWTNTTTDTNPFDDYPGSVVVFDCAGCSSDNEDAWDAWYDIAYPGQPLTPLPVEGFEYSPSPTPGLFPPYFEFEWWDEIWAVEDYGFTTGIPKKFPFGSYSLGNNDLTDAGGNIWLWSRSDRKLDATKDADFYPYFLVDGFQASLPAGDKHRCALFSFLLNTTAEDAAK